MPTDLYMWQQFLSDPRCRAAGGTRPTVLNFPSSLRRDQLPEDRLIELEDWGRNLQDAGWRADFTLRTFDKVVKTRAEETMRLHKEVLQLHGEIEAHKRRGARLRASVDAKQQRIGELRSNLSEERRRGQNLRGQIQVVQSSRTWKLLTKLSLMKSRIPGSG
jgi:chromosome segregation ATPase